VRASPVAIGSLSSAVCVCGLLLTLGCGKAEPRRLPTQPVTGTVHVGGKPQEGIRVVFHPLFDIGEMKCTPNGLSGPDGTFSLGSYKTGDGAPAGPYAVTIDWPIAENEDGDQLGGRYADKEKPYARIEVKEGVNQLKPFELVSKKP
jgi:hypothetical protein